MLADERLRASKAPCHASWRQANAEQPSAERTGTPVHGRAIFDAHPTRRAEHDDRDPAEVAVSTASRRVLEVRTPAGDAPRNSPSGGRSRPASPGGRLLGFKDAAAYLGRSERWLRRAVANRAIRHYKIGHWLAFDPADLDALILRGLREELRW